MRPARFAPLAISSRFSRDVRKVAEDVFDGDADTVLDALARPVRTYYVRCNTLMISPEDLKARLESNGLKVEQNPTIPEALGVSVEGPFEFPLMDQTVVVDKQTAESALQGANVYAPGILRCGSMHVGDRVTLVSEFGEAIGSGTAVMNTNEVLTFRKGLAVRVEHPRFIGPKIRELQEFHEGLLYPQSLAAMATVRVLDPKQGETIVDMNCAPGGKLSHTSQLTQNTGRIFGFDRNSEKVAQARQNMTRLGCSNVILSIHDSRYLHSDLPDLRADRVLVDPPCSALGLRPKAYDFTTEKRINDLAAYQRQFLVAASNIVRPGGVVVYSVCTFTIQECERIVEFAESECGLRVVEQKPFLGSKGLPIASSSSSCQRFHPHLHEIGYFIAKFER